MKKPGFNFNQESGTGLFPSNSPCSLVVWSLMKLETVIDVPTIVIVLKGLINGSMAISNTSQHLLASPEVKGLCSALLS